MLRESAALLFSVAAFLLSLTILLLRRDDCRDRRALWEAVGVLQCHALLPGAKAGAESSRDDDERHAERCRDLCDSCNADVPAREAR